MKLRWIHRGLTAEHCFLDIDDHCGFLWDYSPGHRSSFCERLICDLKARPSEAAQSLAVRTAKVRAIDHAARCLREAIPRPWAEESSWCPIPPSCGPDDPEYDDRLSCVLSRAFRGYDVDVRCLVKQSQSTPPDHRRQSGRLSPDRLYSIMQLDMGEFAKRPVRRRVVLFDDLLTTGKHFKCAARRLHDDAQLRVPTTGFFLARRVLSAARRGQQGPY